MRKRMGSCQLQVEVFKEDGQFIAYCPALDLSTCGKTFEQVQRRFEEVLALFIDDLEERGTLEEVLRSYGWKVKRAPTPRWIPPKVIGHIDQEVSLPAPT